VTDPRRARLRHRYKAGDEDAWELHYLVDGLEDDGIALAVLSSDLSGPSTAEPRELTVDRTWDLSPTATEGGAGRARMLFKSSIGSTIAREIVSPGDIYLGDGETVDEEDTEVAAYIAAVLDSTVTDTGAAIASFERGYRVL
jgi:hypothetical protein